MIGTFRKKPIEVEAAPVATILAAARRNWAALPPWFREAYEAGKILILPDAVLIDTLEGEMRGERNDWIIRGVQGELYPCKPDIFEATYEPAGSSPKDTQPTEVRRG